MHLLTQRQPPRTDTEFLDSLALENVAVVHVQGNPLSDSDMRAHLDVSTYQCAIVLCDELWLDVEDDRSTMMLQTKRIDASIMMVQLNIRKQLEVRQCDRPWSSAWTNMLSIRHAPDTDGRACRHQHHLRKVYGREHRHTL